MKYLWQSTSSNISTGYGVLTKNVCERLIKKGIDLKILGMQNIGHQKEEWNLPLLDDIYGQDSLHFYTKIYEIDYVITVLDHFVPAWYYIPDLLKKLKVKHIAHVTINSAPLSPILLDRIKDADFWVAPSKFAEKVLLDAGFDPKKVRYIPHGVDTKIFKPLLKEEIEKHKEMIGYKDKFVFLSVATNTGFEKNWQGLFYAYKIFLAQNPDAKENTILHCQTDIRHPAGYDLELLGKNFGIEKNIYYIDVHLNTGFPPREMAKLYNLADCHVSAGMGESFGLPMLEGMACGLPQIFPNHTTGPELIGEPETGLLVDLIRMKNGQEFGMTAPSMNDRFWSDPIDMAEKMTTIYKDKKLREKFSKNGIKFAKKFDWQKVIIPEWLEFFKHVEEVEKKKLKKHKKREEIRKLVKKSLK